MFKVSSYPQIDQEIAKDLKAVKYLIDSFSQAHGTPEVPMGAIKFMLEHNKRMKVQNMPNWLLFERVREPKKPQTGSAKSSTTKRKSKA